MKLTQKLRRPSLLILTLIFCWSFAGNISGQESGQSPNVKLTEIPDRWETGEYEGWWLNYKRYSKSDVAAAKVKWAALREDSNHDQGDEWAGEYHPSPGGDLSLESLRWSPQVGFIEIYVYTCLPELRRLDFGTVSSSPSTVEMIPEIPLESGRASNTSQQYLKVKWGERHYLIEVERIKEFCDRIAGLNELKEGWDEASFWIKSGDSEKPVRGLPELPAKYRHLLRQPIDAKITAIGTSYVETDPEGSTNFRTVVPVTLDVGSRDGVTVGIAFRSESEDDYGDFKIIKVGKHTSRALYIPGVWENSETSEPELAVANEVPTSEVNTNEPVVKQQIVVGMKLTTRPADAAANVDITQIPKSFQIGLPKDESEPVAPRRADGQPTRN